MKIVNETRKILDPNILVTATAVRIPIEGGHCESVNITFSVSFAIKDIYEILNTTEGLKVVDDVDQKLDTCKCAKVKKLASKCVKEKLWCTCSKCL